MPPRVKRKSGGGLPRGLLYLGVAALVALAWWRLFRCAALSALPTWTCPPGDLPPADSAVKPTNCSQCRNQPEALKEDVKAAQPAAQRKEAAPAEADAGKSAAQLFVERTLKENRVVIFSKSYCGFRRARGAGCPLGTEPVPCQQRGFVHACIMHARTQGGRVPRSAQLPAPPCPALPRVTPPRPAPTAAAAAKPRWRWPTPCRRISTL